MSVQVTMQGALYWATSPSIGHKLHRAPLRHDTPSRYLREVTAMVELQERDALSNHLAESLALEVGAWQHHCTIDRIALAVRDLRTWCRSKYCRASVYVDSGERHLLVLSQRRGEPLRVALTFANQMYRETPSIQCYDLAGFGEVTVFLPNAPMDVHYAGHCFAVGDLVDPKHPGLVARAHYALEREARRAVSRALRKMAAMNEEGTENGYPRGDARR